MTTDKKTAILRSAAEAFALFGYKGTTMDQVAKMANIGKGTLYTIFSSKEELFDEVISRVIAKVIRVAQNAISHERSFQENILMILEEVMTFRKKSKLLDKLLQEIRIAGTPVAEKAQKRYEEALERFIEHLLQDAIQKGEIVSCDTKIVSYAIVRLYIALTLEWNRTRPPLDKEVIKQYINLLLLNGLTPKQ
ncbi:AcrR family transcriptional regulator [Anoxybacillus calidus]|jgi:TetR/AcrR family transcriptional regulator, regulator of autoinduction and epiphytic fitness|uniref:AcrR family transcriptional regulator n=1 Tax=[Anoxybacillus] calidus TaxID=575178 RepID=A0A7W0BX51_9BACL|nr:TetR/AcrR family transcriptional regulator [Anoxybacillus calidus]MBA2871931.1 AcrR family transcriptional regulator [Anoxybacillus calidus]